MISGFRHEVAKNCALLGYYAARSSNFLRYSNLGRQVTGQTSVMATKVLKNATFPSCSCYRTSPLLVWDCSCLFLLR